MQMLSNDVEDYCAFAGIERITADGYRRSERCFSRYLKKSAERADLIEANVNRWLGVLSEIKSPKTVQNRKRGLTPVWNWLASQGLASRYNPNALRRIRCENKPVSAWAVSNVQALLKGAKDVPGRLKCGLEASAVLTAWVQVAYETGLRPSDMRRLKWSDFGDRGTLRIIQHKTRFPIAKRLSDDAVAYLHSIANDSEQIFPLTKSGMRGWEKKLWDASEPYGFQRRKGQASGTLRKTHGTEVCRVRNPSEAALALGHVSGPRIALQSYIEADAIGVAETPIELINALNRTNPTTSSGNGYRRRTACG